MLACLVGCESAPVGVQTDASGGTWLRYETTFRYFVEQAEGTTDCGRAFFSDETSGYLGVRAADSQGRSVLHWEGMGCDLEVEGDLGTSLFATRQPCRLSSRTGVKRFSVEAIDLDAFDFRPDSTTITASGRITRVMDGQGTTFCFELPGEP